MTCKSEMTLTVMAGYLGSDWKRKRTPGSTYIMLSCVGLYVNQSKNKAYGKGKMIRERGRKREREIMEGWMKMTMSVCVRRSGWAIRRREGIGRRPWRKRKR